VSLRVETGQVVSIIGPNGAGKSTVFKTLFGLLPVRHGQVRFAGEVVTNRTPAELLHRGMTYVPQGRNVFPLMTRRSKNSSGSKSNSLVPSCHAVLSSSVAARRIGPVVSGVVPLERVGELHAKLRAGTLLGRGAVTC
jgi:ABC-type sugar transport system ATPase subunit